MGTRHHQVVINEEGKTKVSQYGQWDGYPSGQGKDILEYLKKGKLDEYLKNLNKIPIATKKQLEKVNSDKDWKINYPYLSRDCGSDIHQMIEDGVVKFVVHIDSEEAKQWCEGFYTIDFKEGTFKSEYHGRSKTYKLNKLPSVKKYLKDMGVED